LTRDHKTITHYATFDIVQSERSYGMISDSFRQHFHLFL